MARTPSTMLELGTKAPDFTLPDSNSGKFVSRTDFEGRPLLVMFLSNHCPFVQHVKNEISIYAFDYAKIGIVGIASNDISTHPQDGPDLMKKEGYRFPYLFDSSQEVAKAFRAACTPDFFLFDKDHRLVYRGQLDDSRPGNNVPVTGKDLRGAIELVLEGKPVLTDQKPSLGCNIKWKKGNEPDYYHG